MKKSFILFLLSVAVIPFTLSAQAGKPITVQFPFTTVTALVPVTMTWTEEDSPNTQYTIKLTGGALGSGAKTIGSIDTSLVSSFVWTPTSDIMAGSGYTLVFIGNGIIQDSTSPFTVINLNYTPSQAPIEQITTPKPKVVTPQPQTEVVAEKKTYASFSEQIADLKNKIIAFKNMIVRLVSRDKKTPSTREGTCLTLLTTFKYLAEDTPESTDVAKLQTFLSAKGYLSESPTGYFGSATVDALMEYQKDNGIRQTGEAGPLTREKIQQESCAN